MSSTQPITASMSAPASSSTNHVPVTQSEIMGRVQQLADEIRQQAENVVNRRADPDYSLQVNILALQAGEIYNLLFVSGLFATENSTLSEVSAAQNEGNPPTVSDASQDGT